MGEFNVKAWAAGLDRRVAKMEQFLAEFSRYQADLSRAPGMAGADPQQFEVMARGFQVLEQELTGIKARHSQIMGEHRDMRTLLSGLEGNSRHLDSAMSAVDQRLNELAYQVGVYNELTQGVAIRPERAVPALRLNPNTGAEEINPVKVHTKPFTLASTPRTITLPPNGNDKVSFVIQPEANQEGDFELFYLMLSSATSLSFRTRLMHTGLGNVYMSAGARPVHGLSVFGNMNAGPQPFSLYETIFLEPGLELVVELFNLSAAPNTIEIVAHGRKFIGYSTSGMDRRALINVFARNTWPFWMTTDSPVLLNSGVNSLTDFNMTLDRQWHGEFAKAMRFGSINGVMVPVDYHLELNEGQSRSLLVDNAPINCVAGNGNFPIALPEPYLALRGTLLTGTIRNDTGLANQTADFVLHGRALPENIAGQRTLEPLLDGMDVQVPPASNKDISIPRVVSR